MSLRDRTRKRLRWFLIGLVCLIVLGSAGYVLRNWQLDKRALASRDVGLKELAAGDYFHALNDIGRYVQRHSDDAKALFSYAQAREQVPAPDNRHIRDAMSLYRRVISLDPKNTAAAEALLKLYTRAGMFAEAEALSQDVLKSDPGNQQAMKAHAIALFALGNGASASTGRPGTQPTTQQSREQALSAALLYNAKWPDDLEGQLLTLQILGRANDGRAKMSRHVQALLDKSPKDPHFQLLMGYVQLASGADSSQARKWIDQASQGALPDTASLKLLVELCDRMGLFQQSFQALQRQASESSDPQARQLLAGRLWEMQRYDELASKFSGDVTGDGDIAALRCMALQQSGKRPEALAALNTLETVAADNPRAQRWASVAKAVVSNEKPDDAAIISACESALREGEDPHIRMLLADAYMRTGDADTAVDSWQTVFKMCPAWGAPLLHLAQASLAAGRGADAAQLAQEALKRLPDNVPAMLALAGAQAMNLTPQETADAQKTLKLLDRIDQLSPNNPAVAPLRVQLLAATNQKDQALAQANRMLSPSAKPSTPELLQLASISRAHHLGLEAKCIERCQQLHGVSVDLALWKANEQLQSGHRSDALGAFDKVRAGAAAANSNDALAWDRARAKLLETLGDKNARGAWESLADSHAKDPQVQWLAISVPSVRNDRPFVRKVLDRLRDQLGDQGLRWRMTQARWLLDDTDNAQSAADAALLLKQITTSAPDMPAPRLMLADCLMRLGNYSGAVEQLTNALARQPQSTGMALKLAALLQSHGENARARGYIDRVTQNPTADLAEIRQAAQLLDAQGDPKAAIAALEHAYGEALKQTPADLVLARLYLHTGQFSKVDAICKKLLVKPNAADLKFAADFYTATGRTDQAQAAMKRLDTVPTAPGEKEIAWGAYLMRIGQPQKAQESFAAATKIAPDDADGWRQLIRAQLANGQDAAAARTARAAGSALPKDAGFAAYIRNSATADPLKKQWPEVVPLLAELLSSPDRETVFTRVVDALEKARNGVLPNSALDNLLSQAAGHSDSAPLQVLAARGSIFAGRMSSPEERVKWMKYAISGISDRKAASNWLSAIEKMSLKGDINERLALAENWQALAVRTNDPADRDHASKLTDRVAGAPDSDKLQAPGVLSLGCLQEAQNKLDLAEANYRKAAQLEPRMGIPQNNLAMLLARKHERLDEALKFAQEAVAVGGNLRASFLDTLAYVQGQRGEFSAAVDSAKQALALQPKDPRFKVRLANMLIDNHQADSAKPILKELQSPDLKTASPDLQKDIQSLEQRLSGTASAS